MTDRAPGGMIRAGNLAWCPLLTAPELHRVLTLGLHADAGRDRPESRRAVVCLVASGTLVAWMTPGGRVSVGKPRSGLDWAKVPRVRVRRASPDGGVR